MRAALPSKSPRGKFTSYFDATNAMVSGTVPVVATLAHAFFASIQSDSALPS